MAVLFNVHPWQLKRMPLLRRQWYEQVAIRHREREHEIRQDFIEAIGKTFGG